MPLSTKLILSIAMQCLLAISCFAEVRVGVILGITGSSARYGEWALRGINLATDEINRAGGINGKQLKLVVEDCQGLANTAVTAFYKLQTTNRINFVITNQSSVALAIAPLANKNKIVQMDVSAFSPLYSTPDDFTFRTGVLANQLSSEISRLIFDQFKLAKIAVLYIENEKGEAGRKSFRNSYRGEIAFEESFKQNETDFRLILSRLKATKLKALFLSAHNKEAGVLVRQAKELGLNLKIFSDVYSIEGQDFLDGAQGAGEGVIYSYPKLSTEQAGLKLADQYLKLYREEPSFSVAQAYDGVIALAHAMKKCGNELTPVCVKQELYSIKFAGASGPIVFDSFGDVSAKEIELKIVRDNKFIKFQELPSRE